MHKIRITDKAPGPQDCMARFTIIDKLTGEILHRFKQKPNSATPLAPEVACRVLAGSLSQVGVDLVPYTAARIEWGQGFSNAPFDESDPDLELPFSPAVFTDLEAPEFTGVKGQVKFFSSIDNSSGLLVGTGIQEVGLRTRPLAGYPKGILIARFQNDSPIALSNSRIKIGLEWVYIYRGA